jgi:hypothetical protein
MTIFLSVLAALIVFFYFPLILRLLWALRYVEAEAYENKIRGQEYPPEGARRVRAYRKETTWALVSMSNHTD